MTSEYFAKHVDDPLHAGWVSTSVDAKNPKWRRWSKGEGMSRKYIDHGNPGFPGKWIACSMKNNSWFDLEGVMNFREAVEVFYLMERVGPYEMATA